MDNAKTFLSDKHSSLFCLSLGDPRMFVAMASGFFSVVDCQFKLNGELKLLLIEWICPMTIKSIPCAFIVKKIAFAKLFSNFLHQYNSNNVS
jgi:hypothetical protein